MTVHPGPSESDRMSSAAKPTPAKKPPKDSLRELVETIVFVVVLVLILKLFVVEAFVIPTGSMAETLMGYHKTVQCEQCGHKFPVNSSEEVEGRKGVRIPVVGYHCPNCDYAGKMKLVEQANGLYRTEIDSDDGDRVLVHKAMQIDHRGSVVVFKFPENPQVDHVAQNYIKRLVGFGGETLAIYHGELFVHKSLEYPAEHYPRPDNPKDLWDRRYTYPQAPIAVAAFEESRKLGFPVDAGGFELIRKPDDQMLAMVRLVYNNEHQADDLIKRGIPPRWKTTGEGWGVTQLGQKVYSHSGPGRGFLKYEHLRVKNSQRMRDLTEVPKPQRITNFMGYNSGSRGSFSNQGVAEDNQDSNDHWAGDLILECKAEIAGPSSSVVLDLARGPNRYQAHFGSGVVKLIRTGPGGKELASRPTPMTAAGTYDLRFANVDCRLRVWVDGTAIDFGGASEYPYEAPTTLDPADTKGEGWTTANDIKEPAAIEVEGDAAIANIVLSRDTYYTHSDNPDKELDTFYVQPGHFLCFGDNSSQSHDGRGWGLVPERLMLGRAVFTFWPRKRFGFIR